MQLNIGSVIRELRKERNATQEALAEHLGISYQAVSKWENGTAYPDITLVPALANYFGITIDRLFGLNDEVQANEVNAVLEQHKENFSKGLVAENEHLLRDALARYPLDIRLVYALSNTLFAKWSATGKAELLDEIIDGCELILRNSLDDEMRYSAIQLLVYTYGAKGDKGKASELATRIPSYINQEIMLVSILDGEEKLRRKCNPREVRGPPSLPNPLETMDGFTTHH